RLVWQGLWVRD
ncbi:hypothetical protein D046_4564B, partial [Vibrio parahaemolyticus V-223/04]